MPLSGLINESAEMDFSCRKKKWRENILSSSYRGRKAGTICNSSSILRLLISLYTTNAVEGFHRTGYAKQQDKGTLLSDMVLTKVYFASETYGKKRQRFWPIKP